VFKASRRIVITAFTATVLVLVVALAASSTPKACSACHAMEPYAQAQAAGAHKNISCYECHLQAGLWDWPAFKLTEVLRMYPRLGASTLAGPASRISPAPCLACHANVLSETVVSGGIRIEHRFCAPQDSCDGCHSATAHGESVRWARQPSMEECVACHVAESAATECDTCHEGRIETERLEAGPWQITHGSSWQNTHGMGDLRYCRTCHPADYCTPCHKTALPHGVDFPAVHGIEALKKDNTCLECHDRPTLCDPCHGLEMPHPGTFLAKHDTIAKNRRDAACLDCHRVTDCEACHAAHTHPGSTDGNLGTSLPGTGGGTQ